MIPGPLGERSREKEAHPIIDLLCVGITLLFFAIAAAFVRGFEALEKEED